MKGLLKGVKTNYKPQTVTMN